MLLLQNIIVHVYLISLLYDLFLFSTDDLKMELRSKSRVSRTRWFLAFTLIRNPALIKQRKHYLNEESDYDKEQMVNMARQQLYRKLNEKKEEIRDEGKEGDEIKGASEKKAVRNKDLQQSLREYADQIIADLLADTPKAMANGKTSNMENGHLANNVEPPENGNKKNKVEPTKDNEFDNYGDNYGETGRHVTIVNTSGSEIPVPINSTSM